MPSIAKSPFLCILLGPTDIFFGFYLKFLYFEANGPSMLRSLIISLSTKDLPPPITFLGASKLALVKPSELTTAL